MKHYEVNWRTHPCKTLQSWIIHLRQPLFQVTVVLHLWSTVFMFLWEILFYSLNRTSDFNKHEIIEHLKKSDSVIVILLTVTDTCVDVCHIELCS